MQYSTRNLAACLLAIYAQETFARPQGIPAQSSSAEVGVSSEASVIPIATSAISISVATDTTIASEVLFSSSSESIATSPASEPAASGLRPLPELQTEEAGPLVPLPGLASDIPPVAVATAIAGGAALVDEITAVTSEAATPAETSVSLRPLPGLVSSAVDEAASPVTTTSELISLVPEASKTAETSVVSSVESTTEVTSTPTSTLELSSLISSSTVVAEDSAFPSSVALETTATEASTTETAAADATSTDATSGFLTSVLAESSTNTGSPAAETTRAAITSRPSRFFPITNGTAPGASGVAGGKPHGTGIAHQSLVTGISNPSGTGGIRFGNSTQTQTSGPSTVMTTSRGGSSSLTTLTTVSDGIIQTLVTAVAAQTSGIARNASTNSATGSDSGAGRPMDMVGGALFAGVAGMLGMLLL